MDKTRQACRLLVMLGALVAVAPRPVAAQGSPTEALSICLLRATTEADRAVLVTWMFAVMAVHPAVQSLAPVDDSLRAGRHRAMAAVVERLVTDACRAETLLAMQQAGGNALQTSFGVLGQTAAEGLLGHPAVVAELAGFTRYLDHGKLEAALKPAAAPE